MKILIIDVNGYILGARGTDLISAVLKQSGNNVTKITLIRKEGINYTNKELSGLNEIIAENELVMISIYSQHISRAIDVTKLVKKIDHEKKVIWGGPHCIAEPELSLEFADIVCFSEGEHIISDLVHNLENKKELSDIGNIAYKQDGEIIKNHVLPPITDLDSLPFSDHDLDTHYIFDDKLEKLSDIEPNNLCDRVKEKSMLGILTTRGCPYLCSYCNNSRQLKLFGKSYLRRRSVNHFIQEIKILSKLYQVKHIGFADDDFMIRSIEEIREFVEIYNKEIDIPYSVFISPGSFSKEKMDILVNSGLDRVRVGVQSGSERILKEIYNRHFPLEKIKDVLKQFDYYAINHKITVNVSFIVDNPYEKPIDTYKTFQLMVKLPRYYKLKVFNLIFLPGTPLYHKAIEDGIIKPLDNSVFRFFNTDIIYQKNYINYLSKALRFSDREKLLTIPLFKILGSKPFFYFGSIFLTSVAKRLFRKRFKRELQNHFF